MKRSTHFLSVVVLVALLVVSPAFSTFAQGDGDPLCNGLSEADCQIIMDSERAMDNVTSFRVPSWSVTMSFGAADEMITFNASGSGVFMFPPDATGPAEGLLVHLVIDEVSFTGPGESWSESAETLVKDNMLYVKVDGEWFGGELMEEDLGDLPDLDDLLDLGDLPDLESPDIDLGDAVTTTRGTDVDMMGQTAASFTTSIDLTQLLTALQISPAMDGVLGDSGLTLDDVLPADIAPFDIFLAPMLSGASITFEQWIGLGDMYVHRIKLDVVFGLDLLSTDPDLAGIGNEFHLMVELDDFNETFDVPVPDSYRPFDELDLDMELPVVA